MKRLIQHNPPLPGKLLQELFFEPHNLSIEAAAAKLRISKSKLSEIVEGRSGISAITAMRLARAFKTTERFWLNLQMNYDLWTGRKNT